MENLKAEVRRLRSFVIGIAGKDSEGEYQPEFVEEMLKASKEKPAHKFKGRKAFLGELRRRRS
ncbi:hypothetical protein HYW53_01785 [Candidatus Giovannonibacteria bacterium]|nr:hypothetical protein [Candidatus Giovannonibacteria bacterium]